MKPEKYSPWSWVPTLYFAEALPYVTVMTLSVIVYKRLDVPNLYIALYTSVLYLPWVIKPLWSPFVDLLKTKRWWVLAMQLLVAAGMAGVAFALPASFFFRATLAVFWFIAFCSATHDIAADGFYMLGLDTHRQAFFVGIRSTFYRIATIAGQGLLVMLAGWLEEHPGALAFVQPLFSRLYGGVSGVLPAVPMAWAVTFLLLGAVFVLFFAYHSAVLPHPAADKPRKALPGRRLFNEFIETFATFLQKKQAGTAMLFMLLYRFPEAQLVKLVTPFLLDPRAEGGLGLTTSQVGWTYGSVGIAGLVAGGIIGGIAVARNGLGRWLWPMALSITVPNIVYVYLSLAQPESRWIIDGCVLAEQFGYGFGFTAYMLFLIYYARGEYQTAHYAIGTAFMAAGMMLPGMVAGWLQTVLGYKGFFIWVMLCCAVTLVVTARLRVEPSFGKKEK